MNNSESFISANKNIFLSLGIIILSIFIVWQVVMPQVNEIQRKITEVDAEKKKIETLKSTLKVLDTISDGDLDRYFELTQKALPQTKDILSVYNELLSAAEEKDVELGDLTINLGTVYSKQKKDDSSNQATYGSSIVSFDVNVDGKFNDLRAFSQYLYTSVPVVEVKKVDIRNEKAIFGANFFYNPLTITTIDTDVPLKPIEVEETTLLNNLQEWSQNSEVENTGNTSSSASPTPSISPAVTASVTPSIKVSPVVSPTSGQSLSR